MCLPSLRDHCPALSWVQCLKNSVSYVVSIFFLVVSGEKVNLVPVILLWPEQLLMKCSLIITLRVITRRYSSLTGGGRLQSRISDYLTLTRREFCSISPSQALGWPGEGHRGFYHTDIAVPSSSFFKVPLFRTFHEHFFCFLGRTS